MFNSGVVTLNNGVAMPVVGLGTYSSENDRATTEKAVRMALKVREFHIFIFVFFMLEYALNSRSFQLLWVLCISCKNRYFFMHD